ncbi:DUF6221 family protein [Micromonospora sp. NPDC023644]|uniref:DUF6221 family protein n=1 Tax=Micromonospora sp. NPDC023644 TaxID=3154321 RepID=UPI00340907F7
MDDLATWLRAQLDDDERVAREALHPDAANPGVWTTEHHNSEHHSEPNRCHIAEDRSGHYWTVAREVFIPNAEHMARWDPGRVLAEVDAKQRILDDCEERRSIQARRLMQLIALPYADRPGYRDEWRP